MSEELAAAPAAEVIEEAPVVETAPEDTEAAAPAAPSTEAPASGEDAPAEVQSVQDFIRKGLDEIDRGPDTGKDEDEPAKTEEEPPKPAAENTEDKEKPKEAEEEAKSDDDKEEPGKDTVIPQVAFKTRAEIDKEFDRVPKEARAEMAKYAEAGLAMQQTLEDLGGEPFIAPLKKIVEGMQGEENLPMFSGLLEGVGIDKFADFIDDTMLLTMVETMKKEPESDGERYFVDKLKDTSRKVIEAMFGDKVSVEYIRKLVTYDQKGHLNTADVDKYFADNPDEDPNKASPALAEKDQRIADLEARLQAAEGKGEHAAEAQHSVDFDKETSQHTHGLLEDLLFKKSILKNVKTDDEVITSAKKAARKLIRTAFDAAIQGNPVYPKLKAGNLKGEATTAAHQRKLMNLVDAAIMQAKEDAAPLEALVSLIYGGKRNAEILERENPPAGVETNGNGKPTETVKKPVVKPGMTQEEWRKHLREELEPTG